VLENLMQGVAVNQIMVDEKTRKWSLVALDRMLKIRPALKNDLSKTTADISVVD
jgi:hypothetical protein